MVVVGLLLVGCCGPLFAQAPFRTGTFDLGFYADESRLLDCVNGAPGARFDLYLWAWVPPDTGTAYITVRLELPAGLDPSARPVFHPLVSEVVIVDYPDDSVEWTMVFDDCPTGWIEVYRQAYVIQSSNPRNIRILGQHSMIRDCEFVLQDVVVLNNLAVNDPECETMAGALATWGVVKAVYGRTR